MPEKGGTRREFILLDAINPVDGSVEKIQISYDRLRIVARRSLGQAKECGEIVPQILRRPTAISLKESESMKMRIVAAWAGGVIAESPRTLIGLTALNAPLIQIRYF